MTSVEKVQAKSAPNKGSTRDVTLEANVAKTPAPKDIAEKSKYDTVKVETTPALESTPGKSKYEAVNVATTPVLKSNPEKSKPEAVNVATTPVLKSNPEKSKPEVAKSKPKNEGKEMNLKKFIMRHLKAGAKRMTYELSELHQLLDLAKTSMQELPTLVEVSAPVNVCGDIHGQYSDLIRIFKACGYPYTCRYLFLGDYVDRGVYSLEVIVLLLACKIKLSKDMVLLRGNHELSKINRVYGFKAELYERYKNPEDAKRLYDHFNEVFAEMPLAALISGKILCMHGGLSPSLNSLDDIRNIKRPISSATGLVQDLLWADPEPGVKGFQKNGIRSVSHVFGEDAVREKIALLKINMIIRAHQVVEEGYAFFASNKLLTVFSAESYDEELNNSAAVVQVDKNLELTIRQFNPDKLESQKKNRGEKTVEEPEAEVKK